MPYICINTAKKLKAEEKENIKKRLGNKISIIPGKTEEVLMIQFNDDITTYFGGDKNSKGTYVDVKCYKKANFEDNQKFTEAVNTIMREEADIQETELYLSISEFDTWGTKGSLK